MLPLTSKLGGRFVSEYSFIQVKFLLENHKNELPLTAKKLSSSEEGMNKRSIFTTEIKELHYHWEKIESGGKMAS